MDKGMDALVVGLMGGWIIWEIMDDGWIDG